MSAQPTPPGADAALVSGEAVALDVRVARAGSRGVALLVDVIVQAGLLAVVTPLAWLGVGLLPFGDEALFEGVTMLCLILVLVGYPVAFETLTGGRTPGKSALGLRVVRDDGGPIRFRHALTRGLVAVSVEWPGVVLPPFTWVACLVTILAHPRGKRVGDLAAGTIVIHERTPAAWGWVPGMPPAMARWAGTLDLTALDDELALAVRNFLARGHGLAEPERSRLGQALATEVVMVTTPPPPPGAPGWAYLAAVLAERHRRTAHRLARARAVSTRLWPELAHQQPQPMYRTAAEAAAWGAPHPGPTGTPGVPGYGATFLPAGPPGTPVPFGYGATSLPPGPTGAPGPFGYGAAPPPAGPGGPAATGPNAGTVWPSHTWPDPPWRAAATGDSADPDWTGLRPPQVASALRPATPRDP